MENKIFEDVHIQIDLNNNEVDDEFLNKFDPISKEALKHLLKLKLPKGFLRVIYTIEIDDYQIIEVNIRPS